jgi:phosphohistidine phosphatase
MSRTLLILRHARSAANDGGGDPARPLAPRGERDAEQVGLWLYEEGLIPDHVVCSPAVRTMQTCALICHGVGFSADRVAQDERIYEAAVDALICVLRNSPPDAQCVLLIGHNPGLEGLVAALTCATAALQPADLAVIGYDGAWAEIGPGTAEPQRLVRAAKG